MFGMNGVLDVSRQNHQFELLNDKFITFAHKVQVTYVKAALSKLINFNNNNSVSGIKCENAAIFESLDSPPSVTSKTRRAAFTLSN